MFVDSVEEGEQQIRSPTSDRLSWFSSHRDRRKVALVPVAHIHQSTTAWLHKRITHSIIGQDFCGCSNWFLNELHTYSSARSSTRLLQSTSSHLVHHASHHRAGASKLSGDKWLHGAYNSFRFLCTTTTRTLHQEELFHGENNQSR